MDRIIWLALFLVLLVIEIFTLGLTTIWFAGGALLAFVMALFDLSFLWQAVVFLVSSIVLFAGSRPFLLRRMNQLDTRTNADVLIGEEGLVLEEIDTLRAKGTVEIKGQIWSARTIEADGRIPSGRIVTVDRIQGVKLLVQEAEQKGGQKGC